ncbi:MAG: hypothetical protein LQ343_005022 [Gyalolechia ehrenbergii]|nr:MAG: hypothetical protein LQ343_005022 [Gyalolechia ehrenbergii]
MPTALGRTLRFLQDRWIARGIRWPFQQRPPSSLPSRRIQTTALPPASEIGGKTYRTDSWTNVPLSVLALIPRRLHTRPSHPISLTRELIESHFPPPTYAYYNDLSPVVTVAENFDSLGFPADHPGRNRSDTYYLNQDTVLRTHTSAHEAEIFRRNASEGYTISADVYRRDAIDRSHYPVFHQMEGSRMWDRRKVSGGDVAKAVWDDLSKMPKHNLQVEDPNPTVHSERNPLQADYHSVEEVEAIAAHLKRSLEGVVVELFSKAKQAAAAAPNIPEASTEEPLRVRWVEAYFPFTSPSWELEVFWQGDWLEVLGCGVTKQNLLINAGVPDQLGWAFGLGLERVAMILFSIPDIRLFWSRDKRFLSQFTDTQNINRFRSFSKHPASYKDASFWLRSTSSAAGGGLRTNAQDFHENDIMEIVREVGGDLVEDVRLSDEFQHPTSGRKSLCYRITYRSLERTLTNKETNELHEKVKEDLVQKLGVEMR